MLPEAMQARTLCEAFQITAAARPADMALGTPDDRVSISWGEYAQRVKSLAAGLAALGVRSGDTVGMMLTNRPEFHLVDTAVLHLGATPFSVYNTSAPEQLVHLFANAGNRVVVTEPAFLPILRPLLQRGGLEHIVLVEGQDAGAISLAELEAIGEPDFDFEASWRAVDPGAIAALIYTSGTTGPPKGVELTHTNLMTQVRSLADRLPTAPGGRAMSYLPAAHLADRVLSHYLCSMGLGFTITSVADMNAVVPTLTQVRPTVWGGVPRVFEKIRAALVASGVTDPALLDGAARAGVRAKLGFDECAWVVIGGAPCPPELLGYFQALGLPLCELYGMTETSAMVTCNPPDAPQVGSCGPALRDAELALAPDGELLVRGPLVMAGYRGDPERTAEVLDQEGWLHTGDIATIAPDGYVSIVDRKKELIINAAGKNMSPANIEAALKAAHPLIGQAIAIGDSRPYNVALIVLDPDAGAAYAREHGLGDAGIAALARNSSVQQEVSDAVAAANAKLSRVEQIKRFRILESDWLPDSDELTPTMKLKRRPIAAKYAAQIGALYSETARTPAEHDAAGWHRIEQGTGRPLVLLHGGGSSSAAWKPVMGLLAEHRRVIALDFPGFGRTPMPAGGGYTIAWLLEQLAVELERLGVNDPVDLVGNSMGGLVALEAAKLGMASSVVGIAPAGLWGRRMPLPLRLQFTLLMLGSRMTRTGPTRYLASKAPALRNALLSIVVAHPERIPWEVMARDLDASISSLRQVLKLARRHGYQGGNDLEIPITIAFGDRDRMLRNSRYQRRDALPGHTIWIDLPGCGHVPMTDDPALIANTILTALRASESVT